MDDPSNPKSLSDQSIFNIFKDREGGIWISTNLGGVNYLPRNLKPFQSYFPRYQSGSISGKAISEFCEDAQGNIWIATEDGGLNYLNTKTNQIKSYLPGARQYQLSQYPCFIPRRPEIMDRHFFKRPGHPGSYHRTGRQSSAYARRYPNHQ